jgi:hypothetical protein
MTGSDPSSAADRSTGTEVADRPDPAGPSPDGAAPATRDGQESSSDGAGRHRTSDPEPGSAPELSDEDRNGQWWRHEDDRWVIGDPGRQPEVTPVPSALIAPTRPDTVVDGGRVGGLAFRAVSLRGLQHQLAGTPRQDSYLVRPTRDTRWLVGCVADGVSEGRRSHEAADIVCRVLTSVLADALGSFAPDLDDDRRWAEAVRRLPWQEAVDRASDSIVKAANDELRQQHERRGDDARAAAIAEQPLPDSGVRRYMSSTAIAFVVSARPGADGWHPYAVLVAAGDSSAYLLQDGAWQRLAGGKAEGGVASAAVQPLPRKVRVEPADGGLSSGDALVIVTDGIGDPLGSGGGLVGRFLADKWSAPPDLLGFAQHAAFYRRSYVDDRTAVVVWADPRPL